VPSRHHAARPKPAANLLERPDAVGAETGSSQDGVSQRVRPPGPLPLAKPITTGSS
jgi:hypothetical protein